MELILLPNARKNHLRDVYKRALTQSTELIIVSAYLTEWDGSIPLGEKCKSFRLIVGKDFGITRKSACEAVMKWLPKKRLAQFRVAHEITGFHPKAVFWTESNGNHFALIGSSNLSKAAFLSNHEINGYSQITEATFADIKDWVVEVTKKSVVVSESWLETYVEAVRPQRPVTKKGAPGTIIDLSLPKPQSNADLASRLVYRRAQMKVFQKNRSKLAALFRTTARSPWSTTQGDKFYAQLNLLWTKGAGGSRFQGSGWERKGRSSNFRELSKSVVAVLDSEQYERDDVVAAEIDRLADLKVPTRKAFFSEMLCQFFPSAYPVLDGPVKGWLTQTNFAAPRGATEGVKYVDLAVKLRAALEQDEDSAAKDMAELDVVIWLASQANG